jgi:hypothetical protein
VTAAGGEVGRVSGWTCTTGGGLGTRRNTERRTRRRRSGGSTKGRTVGGAVMVRRHSSERRAALMTPRDALRRGLSARPAHGDRKVMRRSADDVLRKKKQGRHSGGLSEEKR